jgi:hypothetical protein
MDRESAIDILSSFDLNPKSKRWWKDSRVLRLGRVTIGDMLRVLQEDITALGGDLIEEGEAATYHTGDTQEVVGDGLQDLSPEVSKEEGDLKMGDSSLNATEIAVGSLLAGNRGVGGGGVWGGDSCSTFANPSANAVRADRNAELTTIGQEANRDMMESNFRGITENFLQQNTNDQFNRVCARLADMDNRNSDQRFQAELRTNDRLLALQAEVNANAREAAKCCCDLKLQMCEDKAELKAEILAVEGRAIERSLNAANAKITQLETINALKNGN